MTYRIKALVQSWRAGVQPYEVITNIAGCADEEDAKKKMRALYHVVVFHWVEPINGTGK